MATNYPGSLDTSTQQPSPSSSTEMDDSGFEHDVVHANHSGAIIAVETKVGTGASTPVANSVLGGTGSGTSAWTTTPTLGGLTVNSGGTNNVATFESTDAGALISLKDDTTTGTAYVGLRADGDILKLRSNNTNQVTISANGNATFLGKLLAPDGSASTPAFSFSGDPNTGMLRSGTDELGFATGGTQRLTIKSDGDVGVGTTSPNFPLSVYHATTDTVLGVESGDGGAYIGFIDSNSTGNSYDRRIGAVGDDLRFQTAATDRLTIQADGQVGIGTTTPFAPLQVFHSTTDTVTRFGSGDNGVYISFYDSGSTNETNARIGAYNDTLIFQTAGSDQMVIKSDGDVGIGTTSPAVRLHVNSGSVNNGLIVESTDHTAIISIKDHTTSGDSAVGIKAIGDDLLLRAGDNDPVRIEADGRVAIGDSAVSGRELTVRATQTAFEMRNESDVAAGDVTGGIIRIGTLTDSTNPDTGDYWILFRKGNGATIGSVRGTGSASVNFSTTSDATLKTDLGLTSASRIGTIIDGLQVHEFDWNEGNVANQIGLFAQEAINVLPDSIVNAPTTVPADEEGEDDEYVPAALDYSKIVPILVAECQFLRARVAELESA